MKNLKKIRKDGFAFTVDILGEASVSEIESEAYLKQYMELLDALKKEYILLARPGRGHLDWGHAPKVNVSVKPTALFSQASPRDFEGSVQGIHDRLAAILRKVKEMNGFMRIDMEQYKFKDITLEVYRRLRDSDEFRDYPHLGIVLQAYLKDTDQDLADLLAWATRQEAPHLHPAGQGRLLGLRDRHRQAERLGHPGLDHQGRERRCLRAPGPGHPGEPGHLSFRLRLAQHPHHRGGHGNGQGPECARRAL
jgi:hypothetical protein